MKRWTWVVVGMLLAAGSLSPATASAQTAPQMMCGDRTKVADTLARKYSETPISIGLTDNGSVVEVFTAPTGTWTILMTQPTGLACLLGSGQSWVSVPKKEPGTEM